MRGDDLAVPLLRWIRRVPARFRCAVIPRNGPAEREPGARRSDLASRRAGCRGSPARRRSGSGTGLPASSIPPRLRRLEVWPRNREDFVDHCGGRVCVAGPGERTRAASYGSPDCGLRIRRASGARPDAGYASRIFYPLPRSTRCSVSPTASTSTAYVLPSSAPFRQLQAEVTKTVERSAPPNAGQVVFLTGNS